MAEPPVHASEHAEPKMAEPATEPAPVAVEGAASVAADGPIDVAAALASGVLDATSLRRIWPEVLEVVKRSSRRTRALLDGAQVSEVDGDLVTISIAAAPLARMLGEESNATVIKAALTQMIGGEWRLSVLVANGPLSESAEPVAPPAPPPPKVEVPPPPTPRPAHEREAALAAAAVSGADSDPREDSEPEEDSGETQRHDPEAEALRLLESTLGARPIED